MLGFNKHALLPTDAATVNMNTGRADKWLTGIEPDDSIGLAAQRAVENRLKFLWQCLRKAGKPQHPSAEDVHQARVAARRAMAALETFAAQLPPRRGKWMQQQVKQIRRAAGAARDDDVLLMRLQQLLPATADESKTEDDIPLWQAQLQLDRALHQAPIERIYRKLRRKQFRSRVKELVKRTRWRGDGEEPTYRDAAVSTVRDLLVTLEPSLIGNMPEPEALHALRIDGKRLRYALELFQAAWTAPLLSEEIYPQVETMQNLLGEVNDHVSAIERIDAWIEATADEQPRAVLQQLLDGESKALEAAELAFHKWWQAGEAKLLCAQLRQLANESV